MSGEHLAALDSITVGNVLDIRQDGMHSRGEGDKLIERPLERKQQPGDADCLPGRDRSAAELTDRLRVAAAARNRRHAVAEI